MARDNRASKVVSEFLELENFEAEITTWGTDNKSIAIKGEFTGYEVEKLENRSYELQFRHGDKCVFVSDRHF